MPLPGIVFGSLCLLLVLAAVVVVVRSVRRQRAGASRIEERGWRRLPDGADVMGGWGGWPFVVASQPGKVNDIVVGEVDGVEFMSLRWSQTESGRGEPGGDIERYNMVALRCATALPHLSVVRGDHKVGRGASADGLADVEVGDRRFDARWQLLGDADLARSLLTPEVRAELDRIDVGAWVLQPGWLVRVTKWRFWAGDDGMLEELERAAAPWRAVPAEVWRRYGAVPRLPDQPGRGHGRGWDR
ncbi:hypothetical protein [Nocardioides aequoreus]|uniref:hypothetical protein n=1 Tax=Nocardioides aequoreus TaxID=397278 RepID=UPI0004C462E6|nr:hypothetical protein [Nocardioides aequoreus]